MSFDSPNPYAPLNPVATQEEVLPSVAESLEKLGAVSFAGNVRQCDLDEYLRADGHVGCARLLLLLIGFGGIFMSLSVIGIPFLAISTGATGILVIAVTVSTIPYRRKMFQNANPEWAETVNGSLRPDGVHIRRDVSSTYYHWSWFGEAITSENVIALLPATQAASPLLITREMTIGLDQWDRLIQVTQAIGSTWKSGESEDQRRDQNLRILKDKQRGWRFAPPADAIAFEGIIWSDDHRLLPRRYRRRERPLRTYMVNYGLVGFLGLMLAGCSGLLFAQIAIIPVLVSVYVVAAVLLGRRRRRGSSEVVFYLRGYAFDSALVTDFGLAVSETAWAGLSLVADHEEHLVLRRLSIHNFVVIRRDMLADEPSWIRFRNLLSEKIAH